MVRPASDNRVLAVENVTNDTLYELNGHFDQVLQSARLVSGSALGGEPEQTEEQNTHGDRPAHGVYVNRHEAHVGGFLGTACHGPGGLVQYGCILGIRIDPFVAFRQFAVGEVRQVVLYVIYWGISCHTASRPVIAVV